MPRVLHDAVHCVLHDAVHGASLRVDEAQAAHGVLHRRSIELVRGVCEARIAQPLAVREADSHAEVKEDRQRRAVAHLGQASREGCGERPPGRMNAQAGGRASKGGTKWRGRPCHSK